MAIRAVQLDDRNEWLRMRCLLWPHCPTNEHSTEIDAYFQQDIDRNVVFVQPRSTGGLQGFVEVSIRSYAEGCTTDQVGYIEGWYVDADARRSGVGAALLVAAEAWARTQGCVEMASDTELINVTSSAAHQRLGYTEVEQLVHFRKDLQP